MNNQNYRASNSCNYLTYDDMSYVGYIKQLTCVFDKNQK